MSWGDSRDWRLRADIVPILVFDVVISLLFNRQFTKLETAGHEAVTINIDSIQYQAAYRSHATIFKQFLQLAGYRDVSLICAKYGHVLFTAARENDLGQNLSTGLLGDEGLKQIDGVTQANTATSDWGQVSGHRESAVPGTRGGEPFLAQVRAKTSLFKPSGKAALFRGWAKVGTPFSLKEPGPLFN